MAAHYRRKGVHFSPALEQLFAAFATMQGGIATDVTVMDAVAH